ncbi:hypothetical protein [Enterococcus hirae]|uniref:hypothetical protein n=1 Tax=Enterococcus hirae TaxID=1354 RepID=UPI0019E05CE3|nr:hypothetical protein [Enterococcus hirae]EGP4752372.1 hypothetical protein [Enterococcus faecium]EME7094181.1 hypothetical protein [Enterococcus faecium]EME7139551.1 hypothetical protein [Enterococcus faecium]MBO1101359.1 hypothetical protein [Enterococcus hirae]
MSTEKISLTLRFPTELNEQITSVSKALGFTKTNLIRLSIYEYLDQDTLPDLNSTLTEFNDFKYRMVLNINQSTYQILERQSEAYNLPINKLLVYSSKRALTYYSKLIDKLGL